MDEVGLIDAEFLVALRNQSTDGGGQDDDDRTQDSHEATDEELHPLVGFGRDGDFMTGLIFSHGCKEQTGKQLVYSIIIIINIVASYGRCDLWYTRNPYHDLRAYPSGQNLCVWQPARQYTQFYHEYASF